MLKGANRRTATAREAAAHGIVVNGLPIAAEERPWMADYYREEVVTPGGFIVPADGRREVDMALARKLVREMAEQEAGRRQDAARPLP